MKKATKKAAKRSKGLQSAKKLEAQKPLMGGVAGPGVVSTRIAVNHNEVVLRA